MEAVQAALDGKPIGSMAIIDRITAKIARATHNLQELELGLSAFYATKPYAIEKREVRALGKRLYYLARVDRVPDPLEAIAGDVIQNLRSPLDQIAYQLRLHGSSPPSPKDRVYFPISASSADYQARRRGQIKGVAKEVENAIDATEPYKGGKGHALWQLQHLNNPDKHHELLKLSSFYYRSFDVSHDANAMMRKARRDDPSMPNFPPMPSLFLIPANRLPTMNVGDVLFTEPIDQEVDEERNFRFDVSLHQPGVIEGEPAIKTLHNIAELVGGIVAKLGRFLP